MADISFRETCHRLRREGCSLGEIIRVTGKPKTSVYHHIKDIFLSKMQKENIEKQRLLAVTSFHQKRKGKSKLNRHPLPFLEWKPATVGLIGHFLFDGEITHSACVYTNRSKALINKVQSEMKALYPYPPRIITINSDTYRMSYFNVELAAYMKEKSEELLQNILHLNRECKREFLKSFFDDEGSVYFIKKKRMVRGYQHSITILRLVKELLSEFGILSNIDAKYFEINITGYENIARFAAEIGFSKGLAINPKRANSIWKRRIEKRKLLSMALASYKI